MMGRGDWKKLEDAINGVTVPLGERVAALEASTNGELVAAVASLKERVEALEARVELLAGSKAPRKAAAKAEDK